MVVIKRDKTEENFDVTKIEKAISKAFKACGKKPNYSVIDCVRETYDIDSDEKVDVEMIQDTIEKCLMDIDKDVAKAYIIYRNERAKARDFKYNKKYYTTILELLNGKKNDVSKENANKDPRQFFTMRDLVAGETCKKIYKDFTMDKKLLKLLTECAAIHDSLNLVSSTLRVWADEWSERFPSLSPPVLPAHRCPRRAPAPRSGLRCSETAAHPAR